MNVTLRPGNAADAQRCGEICYNAFKAIAEQHNFPPDFPSPEVATGLLAGLLAHPGFYSVVAEIEGKIVGSNFLDERSIVAGLGPITVDPYVQNRAIGRHLVQVPGYGVRPATELDLDACNQICVKVHGHDRAGELLDAIKKETATVVEHAGRITGYASSIAFFGHAVGETNEALKALIGAAPAFGGPGFLVPTHNAELFRWCLENGLRIVQPMTLMSRGLYSEPIGAFLPSVLY